MTCPYCGRIADFVDGTVIYPHRRDLAGHRFYRCEPCDAHVGCHYGTTQPLGRLANAELRKAKVQAHAAFDPFWKAKQMRRGEAYRWLADQLGIPARDCHIGMFDVEQCQRVVAVIATGNQANSGTSG